MSRKNQTPEILPPKVPGYIVTFSDMVTLLLTFFVMLLTLGAGITLAATAVTRADTT